MKLYIFIALLLTSCQTAKQKRQADNHHAIGISFLKKCDSKQALRHLRKAIDHQPQDPFIRYTLGSAYFLMRKHSLAKEQFEKALELKPNLTEILVSLAINDIEMNSLNRALKRLKLAEEDLSYTGGSQIISHRGKAYFKKKDYKEAQKNFKKIYNVSKENLCFNHLYLGKTEFYLKNYTEAEKALKKSIFHCKKESQNKQICRNKPHSFDEHYFLGNVYKKLNQKHKAKYHFKLFLKQAPPQNPHVSDVKKELKSL